MTDIATAAAAGAAAGAVVGMDVTTAIEISALTGGAIVLVWASATKQRWDTISELFWLARDSLGPKGRVAFAGGLAAMLGYLWWHLVFD